jgi:hypothetical protein
MTVATEKQRLADICEGYITGIKVAYAGAPRNIVSANLPAAVVVLTGEVERRRDGPLLVMARTYRLALIVKEWALGIELEAEALCEPFFDRFESILDARPQLQLANATTPLAGVLDAWLGNDSGVIEIELAGVSYAGVMFEQHVTSLREIERMS